MTVTFPSILKGDLRVAVATPALSIAIPTLSIAIPANAGIQRGWNRACKAELSGG